MKISNNWWVIWTILFIAIIIVGVIWVVTIRRLKRHKYVDYIITIDSPTRGIMRVKVEQKDFHTVRCTLLDGISAGYGFGMTRNMVFSRRDPRAWIPSIFRFKMRRYRRTLPPYSQEEIYNAAKDFIEQLGPSGYLDDGP